MTPIRRETYCLDGIFFFWLFNENYKIVKIRHLAISPVDKFAGMMDDSGSGPNMHMCGYCKSFYSPYISIKPPTLLIYLVNKYQAQRLSEGSKHRDVI